MSWTPFKDDSPPARRPTKPLWTIQQGHHTYTCELVFYDQGGTEARILKGGELMVGRRFEEGWQTLQWAEEERKVIEQGGE
jgi:hypothetical protein